MCNLLLQNGKIIGVDADNYVVCEKTRIIRLYKGNNQIATFNMDKIAGVIFVKI